MNTYKLSPQVQLALKYQNLFSPVVSALFIVDVAENIWELIVQYVNGMADIEQALAIKIYYLNGSFAIVQIKKEDINRLAGYPNMVYISFAMKMSYIDISLDQICATNVGNPTGRYNLTGRGILIGIIDTGIDYKHPDFISENQTSRIRYLWDQTIVGNPPEGFETGTEYTNENINNALLLPTKQESLEIVPSTDVIGHGTAMAGIAAGNGRASREQYKGVAPECEFIIVKIGPEGGTAAAPTDKYIMLGIKYVLDKALELNKPISILLGVGTNIREHSGGAVLERYINQMANVWKCNFVVGTGNQANKGSHASGKLNNNETQVVQFFIDKGMIDYQCSMWKPFIDRLEIVVESPKGELTETLSILTPNRAFVFGNTVVMVNFALPGESSTRQEILIWLQASEGAEIDTGLWTILIRAVEIFDGSYNIWGSIIEDMNNQTRFLQEDPFITLTIPSTASRITSTAAFNGVTSQLAAFSGRGFTSLQEVKPDITAPGVGVITTSIKQDMFYEPVSGTSAAAAFVAGAYAVLLEYSIASLGEQYLYGDSLRFYLLRNARRPQSQAPYPNPQWGYGILCIEQALDEMRETMTNV